MSDFDWMPTKDEYLAQMRAAFTVRDPKAQIKAPVLDGPRALTIEEIARAFDVPHDMVLSGDAFGMAWGIPIYSSPYVKPGQIVSISSPGVDGRGPAIYVHRHRATIVRYRRKHGRPRNHKRRPVVERRWVSKDLDRILEAAR